jgi:hypothetical protein
MGWSGHSITRHCTSFSDCPSRGPIAANRACRCELPAHGPRTNASATSYRCVAKPLLPEWLDLDERCIALRRGRHSGVEVCVLPPSQQSGGEGAFGIRALPPEARCRDEVLVHRDVVEVAERILQMLKRRHEFLPALRHLLTLK